MKIPHSFKRGVAFFSVLTTIFALLFFLVDLDKNNLNNHEDLRNLEGGAI